MKKTYLFSCFLLCSTSIAFAQTKLISHKSHSGSNADFKVALANNLFDIGASNFGVAPQPIIQTARLDSLIHLSEEAVIMVTSKVCTRPFEDTSIWSAGKDTVFNHPLFAKQHSLDHIREVLDKEYHFDNRAETVTFVGYDNAEPAPKSAAKAKAKKEKKAEKKNKKENKNKLKKAKQPKQSAPMEVLPYSVVRSAVPKFWWIGMIGLFSLLIGWMATKIQV